MVVLFQELSGSMSKLPLFAMLCFMLSPQKAFAAHGHINVERPYRLTGPFN